MKGTFHPSRDATKLSKAEIFSRESTPMILRYSTSPGIPDFPDNTEDGSRGFAMRFLLSDDGSKHYDVITNNGFGFITGTPEGFLEQFQAKKAGKFQDYLDKYPHAKYFAENQDPSHAISLATETWHSVQAFKFVNAAGDERFFRYRLVPWQGAMKYSKADAAKQEKNWHFKDLEYRLTHNKPFKYRLMAQLANPGDQTNDSTKTWPETNDFAEMGEIVIEKLWQYDEGQPAGEAQKRIIYDPTTIIDGIELSDDPILKVRSATYQLSGKIRREHIKDGELKQATDLKI